MKKLIMIFQVGLFFYILSPFNSFPQYIPLLKNNAIWNVFYLGDPGGFLDIQQLTGDTVINNITYKTLPSISVCDGPYILREDTIAKKVYQYHYDTEFLLYDFSLPIGGIFNYTDPQSPGWTTHLRLDSITGTIDPTFFKPTDWTTIDPLRVYYFSNTDFPTDYQILWVEGLGSLSGLLLPAFGWGGEEWLPGGGKLLCHNSTPDTIDYYFLLWWEIGPCMGPLLGLNNTEIEPAVNIYPVPITSNEVMIKGEDIVLVQFFNSLSVNILNHSVSGTQSVINLSDFPKGIYFLKIHFKNGQSIVRKAIKN